MISRLVVFLFVLGVSLSIQAEAPGGFNPCPAGDSEHKPVHRGVPAWPHVAHMLCLEGSVVVEFTIDTNGAISHAEVVDAHHPGIFDRVALNAVQHWRYFPRCEDGVPVETQHRTALDFFLEDDFRPACLAGAALLTGEALELATSLGLLYSMLAEWYMQPWQTDLPDQIEAELVPGFEGDLGRVERFHHQAIADMVDAFRVQQSQLAPSIQQLLMAAVTFGRRSRPLPDELIPAVRTGALAWHEQSQTLMSRQARRFAALESEVDMDPDLLTVLVHPFLGDVLRESTEQPARWQRNLELTEAVVDLLEDPEVDWTLQSTGFKFDQDEDQARFKDLIMELLALQASQQQDFQRAMLGFLDYRP